MTKRIPELDPMTELGGDDLFEVAQVDFNSPTGYSSRKIRYGDMNAGGGSSSLPFRFPFEGEASISASYSDFRVSFPYELIRPIAVVENDGGYNYSLVSASMKIQLSALVSYVSDPNGILGVSTEGSVWYSRDFDKQARIEFTNGPPNYTLPNSNFSHYTEIPFVYPSDVWMEGDGDEMGELILEFRVAHPYNEWTEFTKVKFRGYAEITAAFDGTSPGQ